MADQNKLQHALALAAEGFHVFPIRPWCGNGKDTDGKEPAIKNFPQHATRNEDQIRAWWDEGDYNVGISTTRFNGSEALLVVDVDQKKGKDGLSEIFRLEMEGYEFPPTREHSTTTGGRHLVYRVPAAVKQGVDVFAPGLDVRSRGGYVLGPGSALGQKSYDVRSAQDLAEAPEWMVLRCGIAPDRQARDFDSLEGIDEGRAASRALDIIKSSGAGLEGSRNQAAFRLAAKIKDVGASERDCVALLEEHWDCQPPLDSEELAHVVHSAYKYGQEARGVLAPEAVFSKITLDEALEDPDRPNCHPFDVLNQEFAFVLAGGGAHILWETTDKDGEYDLQHLSISAFTMKHAAYKMVLGKNPHPVTQLWMESDKRRSYDGLVFAPEKVIDNRWYNLWRGFSYEAKPTGPDKALKAFNAFREHLNENICCGEVELANWLWAFFAHMIQKPWEKPLVALVFKGKKGVGKNVCCEHVGALFAPHFMVADDDRYLLSNFNGHLEKLIFMVLDEAAWAGDKRAEGRLKGLITGKHHNIELKGKEGYKVDNLTRIAILGNEEWLVPASDDERRFAVFNVGEGRRRDNSFFQEMKEGMQAGGYEILLHHLRHRDISGIDVNNAPNTKGLVDQKHASLDPIAQWWLDCLQTNQLLGSDFDAEGFPTSVYSARLREAYTRYSLKRNIKGRIPTEISFAKTVSSFAPSFLKKGSPAQYTNPGVAVLRKDWETYIGGEVEWDK